jgi:hypothetical protein
LCRDETRTSEHIGISPAEEGWTVANDNERYLVAALTCNVLQHTLSTDSDILTKTVSQPNLTGNSTLTRLPLSMIYAFGTRGTGFIAQTPSLWRARMVLNVLHKNIIQGQAKAQ